MATQMKAPTVRDLRTKVCYICQEEERYQSVHTNEPRTWVHPCKCTLVAHEECLLKWISASQTNKPRESVKCPQCGFVYEWESDSPLIFRLLDAGNGVLDFAGKSIVAALVGAVVGGTFSGAFVVMTAYGAFAIRQLFGKEMFDLVLTSDYRRWPYTAFLNLPAIPLMLLISRAGVSGRGSLESVLGLWPASAQILNAPRYDPLRHSDPWASPRIWPLPVSLYAFFVVPLVKNIYRRLRLAATNALIGENPIGTNRGNDTEFVLHLGPVPLFFRFQGREDARPQVPHHGDEEVNHPVEIEPRNIENAPELVDEAENGRDGGRRMVSLSSIGRFVGGALLVPTISSLMGSLLLRLSKYSTALRRILAVRPPLAPHEVYSLGVPTLTENASVLQILGHAARYGFGTFVFGYEPWSRADPVWLRNSIGLGLFILAKDAVSLLHVYLAKRELATRRVKTRNFAGIDPSTLDLIEPSKFHRPTVAQSMIIPPPTEVVEELPRDNQPAIADPVVHDFEQQVRVEYVADALNNNDMNVDVVDDEQ